MNPHTYSAPAPYDPHPQHEDVAGVSPAKLGADDHIHELCENLAWWCRTRRFFGSPNTALVGTLSRLQKRSRPLRPGGPDGACSAELAALYLAVIAQPPEALDRHVFELHYLHRVHNVKAAAAHLGISRNHWYRLLRGFRRRIYAASREILATNEAAAQALPHLGGSMTLQACAA